MNAFRNGLLVATLILVASSSVTYGQDKKDKVAKSKNEAKKFDKKGLQFRYPAGWKIGGDHAYGATRLVIMNGPNNAIVTIQFSEFELADSIEEYAKEYSKVAAAEIKKSADLSEEVMSKTTKDKNGFEVIKESFTIENGIFKLPHDRKYFRKKFDKYACFIVCQTKTENLEKVQKGFQQIVTTLKFKSQ